jgi:membrane protein
MTAQASERPRDVPSTTGKFSVKDFGKRLLEEIKADKVTGLGAQVAYSMVFAVPPLLVLLITIAAIVDRTTGVDVTGGLRNLIATNAPGDAKALLDRLVQDAIAQVSGGTLSFSLIVSTLLAIWGGSGGISALIDAFNTAYEVEDDRKFLPKMLTRIGLTLAMIILVVLSFTLFVFGENIGEWVARQVGLGSVFTTVWNILRWPIAAAFILFLLAVLYYFGPNIKQSFRWVSPGSVAATTLFVVAILGIKLYLAVSDPGSAYGVAGSVIVLLFFFYVVGIVFILGAEINSILQKRVDPAVVQDIARNPEKVTNPEAHAEATHRAREMGRPVSAGGDRTPRSADGSAVTGYSQQHERQSRSFKGLAGMLVAGAILDRIRGRKGSRG